MKNVRVLVVDDSALMRKLIPQIIERDSSIHVVGTAMDGSFALDKIPDLKPDVVTLDLEMPRMDGMETIRRIMRKQRLPIIVVSSHTTDGASATFKALGYGAFDFVAKPQDTTGHMEAIAAELIAKIKAAARSRMPVPPPLPIVGNSRRFKKGPRPVATPTKIIAIGISTGGPQALQYVLPQLSSDFRGSIVIVQHMPEGFTEMFARRLDETCAIEVKEARSGDLLVAGRALVCPGNRHIRVRRMPLGDVAVLSDGERVNGHRPSVDVLFQSVAHEFGERGMAVLMTGMGEDGAEGMRVVRAASGITIAQSEQSCVVYGMPRAAIERGYAMRIVGLEGIANTLQAQCTSDNSSGTAAANAPANV